MKINKKIFIACDTNSISKVKNIINLTNTKKLKIGYKFGLEFFNSKNGRSFVSKIKKKIIFADLKLHDIPNTCSSTVRVLKDLKRNYLTVHISSGLSALRAVKLCQPLRVPTTGYERWKDLQLNFDAKEMLKG